MENLVATLGLCNWRRPGSMIILMYTYPKVLLQRQVSETDT